MSDQMLRRLVAAGRKVVFPPIRNGVVEVEVTMPDGTARGRGDTVRAALGDLARHDKGVEAIIWPRVSPA